MVTYAIGDIQGCGASLARLLQRLPLEPDRDALWFTGDLVNRGPHSLAALRQVVALSARYGSRCVCVLGNHDLHLLARAAGLGKQRHGDTLDELLAAPDRDTLIDWLRRRPLLHRQELACAATIGAASGADAGHRDAPREAASRSAPFAQSAASPIEHVLVHAGLHPAWSVDFAARLADEVQAALGGADWKRALAAITDGSPSRWDDTLTGDERLAASTAFLTRIRTCRADGRMCRDFKGPPVEAPARCTPWYAVESRRSRDARIVFGHWAALGLHRDDGVLGLDTGCVWGGALTALRLEDGALFQQSNVEDG